MLFEKLSHYRMESRNVVLAIAVLTLLVVGLTTQSLRSLAAYSSFPIALITLVLVLLFGKNRLVLSRYQTSFVIWMTAIAVVIPVFTSKSAVYSLEFGYVVALGCVLMFFITPALARLVLYALVTVSFIDSIISTAQLMEGSQRAFGLYGDIALRTLYLWISTVFIYFTTLEHRSRGSVIARFLLIGFLLFGLHTGQSFTVNFLVVIGYLWLGIYAFFKDRAHFSYFIWFLIVGLLSYGLYLWFAANVDVSGVRELAKVSSLNGRTPIYTAAWELVREAPFFGVGSGLFMYLYPSIRTEWGSAGLNVHNDYLEYWATAGIVGALPLILVAVYFVYRNIQALHTSRGNAFTFSGLLVSIMGLAFLNFFFWRIENFIIFAALWRLMDGQLHSEKPFVFRDKVALSMLMALPFLVLSARLYENFYGAYGNFSSRQQAVWTETVLGRDSGLLTHRASLISNTLASGDTSALPEAYVTKTKLTLDKAIAQNAIRAAVYCARADLGLALGESPNELQAIVDSGIVRDPSEAYCQSVGYANSVARGDLYSALSNLRLYFLSSGLAAQANPEQLNAMAQRAAYDAFQGGEQVFAKYFSRLHFQRTATR